MNSPEPSLKPTAPANKRENPWLGFVFSLILPIMILKKFSDVDSLGPLYAMLLAVSLPIANGLWEWYRRNKFGLVPFLGLANVVLTGGIVLFEVGGIWFAVKEAAIPLLIGIAIYLSQRLGKPIVKSMFINDQLIQVDKVQSALQEANALLHFDQDLKEAGFLITVSFMLSALLNFLFAIYIVTAAPGTAEFNDQVGTMQGLSFFAIVGSCSTLMIFALFRLGKRLQRYTGMAWEDILRT